MKLYFTPNSQLNCRNCLVDRVRGEGKVFVYNYFTAQLGDQRFFIMPDRGNLRFSRRQLGSLGEAVRQKAYNHLFAAG